MKTEWPVLFFSVLALLAFCVTVVALTASNAEVARVAIDALSGLIQ